MLLGRLRRHDPWWEMEGSAARRRRRWNSFVSLVAFVASLGAIGAAGLGWAIRLGFAGLIGFDAALALG